MRLYEHCSRLSCALGLGAHPTRIMDQAIAGAPHHLNGLKSLHFAFMLTSSLSLSLSLSHDAFSHGPASKLAASALLFMQCCHEIQARATLPVPGATARPPAPPCTAARPQRDAAHPGPAQESLAACASPHDSQPTPDPHSQHWQSRWAWSLGALCVLVVVLAGRAVQGASSPLRPATFIAARNRLLAPGTVSRG